MWWEVEEGGEEVGEGEGARDGQVCSQILSIKAAIMQPMHIHIAHCAQHH